MACNTQHEYKLAQSTPRFSQRIHMIHVGWLFKLFSRNQASESTQLRATRAFFFHYYLANRRPIELKFSKVYYFRALSWDIPSEKTGLWQLPIMSTVFKIPFNLAHLHAKTKTTVTAVNLLEYADDCAIASHSEAKQLNKGRYTNWKASSPKRTKKQKVTTTCVRYMTTSTVTIHQQPETHKTTWETGEKHQPMGSWRVKHPRNNRDNEKKQHFEALLGEQPSKLCKSSKCFSRLQQLGRHQVLMKYPWNSGKLKSSKLFSYLFSTL